MGENEVEIYKNCFLFLYKTPLTEKAKFSRFSVEPFVHKSHEHSEIPAIFSQCYLEYPWYDCFSGRLTFWRIDFLFSL